MENLNRKVIQLITKNPELIKKLFEERGYDFYEKGIYNVNNFGIRISLEGSDFNDLLGTVYKSLTTDDAPFECFAFEGTTDPGTHYLQNPLNYKGTAILAAGQYKGFKIDKHRGQYDALCQRAGKVKVYRDNDKDKIAEIDLSTIDEGMFGVNIHKNSKYEAENDHNKFSAGCQESLNDADYFTFMAIQYKAEKIWGNDFTYTLFDIENDKEDREAFEKVFPMLFDENYEEKVEKDSEKVEARPAVKVAVETTLKPNVSTEDDDSKKNE